MSKFNWKEEFIPSSVKEFGIFVMATILLVGTVFAVGFINL